MTAPSAIGGYNIAARLSDVARERPDAPAMQIPNGSAWTMVTYRELDAESDAIAAGLDAAGIGPGVRTVLMVKPSREFFALTFGIFKAGAVPVVVDPGIGLKSLAQCLAEAEPEAFIGIPAAHAARIALRWARGTLTKHVTVGRRWFWGGPTLDTIRKAGAARSDWQLRRTERDDVAAILFTSGSTGVPKGVVYTHGNFSAQVDMIRERYAIRPGEIDLPTFPLFALFDPALGMTTVVPDMDPRKPASVDPTKIIGAIERFGVTNMFGSPALLNTVGRYGASHGVRLPTLKRVISAGAPVPADVMERFLSMLEPDARVNTPYGATESLPVASIDSAEVLGETAAATARGAGVCVGRPVDGADVRIIAIRDDVIASWADVEELPAGEIGEICVAGPMVTRRYYGRDEQTALAKIEDPSVEAGFRHRMGDLGYKDEHGRVWFCGRKKHRVTRGPGDTLFTIPCEGVFNAHPQVYRTALVGVGPADAQRPVLCVERDPDVDPVPEATLIEELQALAQTTGHTVGIADFLVHPGFPVDIRHNAKIGREKLAVWAEGRL